MSKRGQRYIISSGTRFNGTRKNSEDFFRVIDTWNGYTDGDKEFPNYQLAKKHLDKLRKK